MIDNALYPLHAKVKAKDAFDIIESVGDEEIYHTKPVGTVGEIIQITTNERSENVHFLGKEDNGVVYKIKFGHFVVFTLESDMEDKYELLKV